MDEAAFAVGDGFCKAGCARSVAERGLHHEGDGGVNGEAAPVQAVCYASHFRVVRGASVAAGERYGAPKRGARAHGHCLQAAENPVVKAGVARHYYCY